MNDSILDGMHGMLMGFATWLVPILGLMFLLGIAARVVVFYILKRHLMFIDEFENRIHGHLGERQGQLSGSFYVTCWLAFKNTFLHLTSSGEGPSKNSWYKFDRFFSLPVAWLHIIQVSLGHFQFIRKGEALSFREVAKTVMADSPLVQRSLGFFSMSAILDTTNMLPRILLIGGVLGTVIGINHAVPSLGAIDLENMDLNKIVMDDFFEKISFSMLSMVGGIVLSIFMSVLNGIFATDLLYVKTVDRLSSVWELLWARSAHNETRGDLEPTAFCDPRDPLRKIHSYLNAPSVDPIPPSASNESMIGNDVNYPEVREDQPQENWDGIDRRETPRAEPEFTKKVNKPATPPPKAPPKKTKQKVVVAAGEDSASSAMSGKFEVSGEAIPEQLEDKDPLSVHESLEINEATGHLSGQIPVRNTDDEETQPGQMEEATSNKSISEIFDDSEEEKEATVLNFNENLEVEEAQSGVVTGPIPRTKSIFGQDDDDDEITIIGESFFDEEGRVYVEPKMANEIRDPKKMVEETTNAKAESQSSDEEKDTPHQASTDQVKGEDDFDPDKTHVEFKRTEEVPETESDATSEKIDPEKVYEEEKNKLTQLLENLEKDDDSKKTG